MFVAAKKQLKNTKQPNIRRRTDIDLRIVPLGFFTLIAIGALLLVLPWSHLQGRSVGFLDALFLSTSATCVTGLTTINVSETFNIFGQTIILLLIQLGGVGIFTATILMALLSGNRLTLSDEETIHATIGKLRNARPLDIFIYGVLFVILFEMAGTVALFCSCAELYPGNSRWQTLWESAFHSVSAFCNAGISIYPEGFSRWREHLWLLAITDVLVIAGGIGLTTLINLRYYRFWRRDTRSRGYLTLQTRLTLILTTLLLVIGTAATFAFEQSHTLRDAHGWNALAWSFFHSSMSRTAGFNVVDIGDMNPPTLLITLLLMFIGGSPSSMAGGIKTVTFFLLLITAWGALRRTEVLQIFGRQIPRRLSGIAIMMALLAFTCVILGIGLLMITEADSLSANTQQHWFGLVFEAVSAFGTVGLSTGVTPLLSSAGKLVITLLMFTGRVGPLVLSVYLTRPARLTRVRYPKEELSLG